MPDHHLLLANLKSASPLPRHKPPLSRPNSLNINANDQYTITVNPPCISRPAHPKSTDLTRLPAESYACTASTNPVANGTGPPPHMVDQDTSSSNTETDSSPLSSPRGAKEAIAQPRKRQLAVGDSPRTTRFQAFSTV
ncbi:hypothetical protein NA56DRAFT_713024 [Hyaloscypha hepaticicola]|uniref:Uncharacterized protein n=1 Tax=Hyaloscypha hepaticicola TaxID=2082293 RepID=A0A2J6PET6_9HELO|nr:hypothetical protein NA56DRAFT_713024 [Hyaloscypha hepaticicola]